MPGPNRLFAVVVTHNRLAQLQATVAALLAEPSRMLTGVIVVDNASTDGTADWLTTIENPRLLVERLPENRGGAGGFAHGMAIAHEQLHADWTVVLDDDARPEPGALPAFHRLLSAGELDGMDGLAAAVRHPDGTICRMNRPTLNPFWHARLFLRTALGGGRRAFHLQDADYDAPALKDIDGASFVGLFLSRRAMERAGYPDPSLFLYADDAIHTMTLSKKGGRLVFAPAVRFVHDTASLSHGGIVTPPWKAYYYHRNLLLLYRIAAGPLFWAILPLWLWAWPRLERHYPEAERPIFRRVIRRAIRDALRDDRQLTHAEVLDLASDRTV